MSYKIGSFNMYKFQAYRSDNEIKKDLDRIAQIIIEEGFDIVAMQEIFGKTPMDLILRRLGSNWEGHWEQPNSLTYAQAEGYAFIWNTKRIELAKSVTTTGKRTYQPRIYNQYKIDTLKGQIELARNPLYGRFKPLYENFELRLINTHIMFSKSTSTEANLGDIAMRRNEFEILIKNILAKENSKTYGNNLPAYTILLGDYNLNLNRSWTKYPYLQEIVTIQDGYSEYNFVTVQDQLTTIKAKSNSENNASQIENENCFSNNYDHFSYDYDRFNGVGLETQSINTVEKYTENDFDKHRKEISDHIPVYIKIDMKG